jgi:predicted ATPase/DNA-binding NarL/FixJ family response regulator
MRKDEGAMAGWTDRAVQAVGGVDRAVSGRAAATAGGQPLPGPLSSFIGRERELAEVDALLDRARLVTLTGAGCTGKTRLAIEVAGRTASRLHIDSAFVDLAPISDADLVLPTVATAVGVRPKPPQTVNEALVEGLAARPLLVVLDNLEQLLPGIGTTIVDLLTSSPELRVLATSRASLHVRGEQEYRLDPLAQREAETLFVERAQAVDSHLALTDQTRAAVEEICRRLDGLPLAIELAAAHSKILTPEALLRRVERGLAMPGSAPVDAPARQRTLHDTIAWSYGLLDRTDQVVLARLAGFVGGFSAAAADATVPDPQDKEPIEVMGSLGRLVDHNLLRATPDARGEPRFSLLEIIREFALEELPATQLERFRERHATYFVAEIARRTGHGSAPLWPETVADELENVRAALTWAEARDNREVLLKLAVAMWWLFGVLGHGDEAGRWLHAAERAASSGEPALRAGLLFNLARQELAFGGDRRQAQDLLKQALRFAADGVDPARTIRICEVLSNVASDFGERSAAQDWMRRAISETRSLEDPVARARFLAEIAGSGHAVHDVAETKALAAEALRDGRAYADSLATSSALIALAYVALAENDALAATRAASEALALQQKDTLDVTSAMAVLALAQTRAGDFDAPRIALIDALRRARRIRAVWLCLATLEASADWLSAVGRPELATTTRAAVDAIRVKTLDRTPGDDMGVFIASRVRDRETLSASAYHAALELGRELSLDDALAFAIRAVTDIEFAEPQVRAGASRSRHDLTNREQEVLQLLAAGRSDGQIANELFISKKTAAVHVANIKGKLGAGSRVEIATTALELGLVERPNNDQLAGR